MISGKSMIRKVDFLLFRSGESSDKFLVFFRIAIGAFVLLHFLASLGDLNLLFGSDSIIPPEISHLYTHPHILTNHRIAIYLGMELDTWLLITSIGYITLSLFITLGFLTRFSTLGLIILHISLMKSNVFLNYGADYFTSMSLFYLLFFPVGKTYSLDSFIWKTKPRPSNQYFFFRNFLRVHLVLVYVFSGIDKSLGFNWWNGESIWKVLNLPYVNLDFKINFDWLAEYPTLLMVMGWLVVALEIAYPLICVRRFRTLMLCLIIGMHIGIAVVLNLYFFSAIMIIWNLAAFYPFKEMPSNAHVVYSH